MRVLIIIPAYNEAGNIERVVNSLIDKNMEYVVINDGSKDETAEICIKNHYNLINHVVNLGLAGAFQTGMKYAVKHNYDAAIQFDADGQHRVEYIEDMVKKLQEGYDIIIGSRYLLGERPKGLKAIGSNLIKHAIKFTTGECITDPTSGMRLYAKKLIVACANSENFGPEPDTISLLLRKGAKVAEIPVIMNERIAGESYLNISTAVKYMVRILISILVLQNFRKIDKIF